MGSSACRAALCLLLVGCAKRTDAEVRQAWNARADAVDPAVNPDGDDAGDDGGEGPRGKGRRPGSRRKPLAGWAGVERLLTRATFVMAGSPEPKVLASLATRWCEDEPDAQDTESGWVRTCEPVPPVQADGYAFTLEIGAVGVIGLVAQDLSRRDAARLVQAALRETRGLCSGPFQSIASTTFHTCPIEGGSTLAVGHFPKSKAGKGWGVSISVLGAS